jgi:hypothetical protein
MLAPYGQRKTLDYIAQLLGIQKYEDWFHVRASDVRRLNRAIMDPFQQSLHSTLQAYYPEFEWNPLLFHYVPHNLWLLKENHRKMMDLIGEYLGVEKQEDWYHLTLEDVHEAGGHGLLYNYYNNSLFNALQSIYPEFDWYLWFRKTSTSKQWTETMQRKYMGWLQEQLHAQQRGEDRDWMRMSKLSNRSAISSHWRRAFQMMSNEPFWNLMNGMKTSEGQSTAQKVLKSLLNTNDVFSNFRFIGPNGESVELDIYIPSLALAFEYHGEMHFNKRFYQGSLQQRQVRDSKKQLLCKQRGITLIQIPYWWNTSTQSLSTLFQNVLRSNQHLLPYTESSNALK